ncbi:hypothetical protein PG985_008047 [Apiospora marii]|uniref:Uncharacterized protein n=1 Tax=Apiospora marii TaxID=335849 RepID=A0ABR1R9A4_9PEZI
MARVVDEVVEDDVHHAQLRNAGHEIIADKSEEVPLGGGVLAPVVNASHASILESLVDLGAVDLNHPGALGFLLSFSDGTGVVELVRGPDFDAGPHDVLTGGGGSLGHDILTCGGGRLGGPEDGPDAT